MERKLVLRDDVVHALKQVGVQPGQAIMVHTSLGSLGYVLGGAQVIIEALLECVGPDTRPFALTAGDMSTPEGEALEEPRTPQMEFFMQLPKKVPAMSILRRSVDLSPK